MASIEERIKYSICQMAHISITDKYFPAYLRLEMKKHILHLREKKYGFADRTRRYEQNICKQCKDNL